MILGIAACIILSARNTFALPGMRVETEVNIRIEKEWKGRHCSYTKATTLAIYSEDQWKEVWGKVYALRLPRPELPKIDFEKEMVVAVFMGERPSGGYSIEIINIVRTEEEIVVAVKEKEPPADSLRTMALTQPYHIVAVKRYFLPVKFQHP